MNKFSSRFDKLSLLKKVVLVPIVSMILSAFMLILNYNTSNSIANTSEFLYKKLIPLSEYSTNNKFLLNQIAENFSNAVVSSESFFLKQAITQANQIRRNISDIEKSNLNFEYTNKALISFEAYYEIASKTSKLILHDSSKDISKAINFNELNELFDNLNKTKIAFEELDNEIKNNIDLNFKKIEYTTEIIINNELITISIMYLILFVLTFFIYTNINKRFRLLVENIVTLSKMSSFGSRRIEKVSNDELGVLTTSLNEMLINYENNVSKLHEEKMTYFDLSHKDKLTDLFNRHYLDSVLNEYEKRITKGFIFGVIILDIDDFKLVNDNFGHQKGDDVLKVVAKILKQNIRKIDIIGRWGGEEFICFVIVNNKKSLFNMAENLRKIIENTHIDKINTITASFGCALINKDMNSNTLIANADKALYKAKKSGKNQVEVFED